MTSPAPAPATAPILAVERIEKRLGGMVALSDVSFSIRAG